MNTSATAFASSTRNVRSGERTSGAQVLGSMLGIFIDALCESVSLVKLEGSVDPVAMLEVTSKVASFVKANTDKPETVKVDTSLHGEITIHVKGKRIFEAKKDFMNDQKWTIEVDRRVHEALTKPNLF